MKRIEGVTSVPIGNNQQRPLHFYRFVTKQFHKQTSHKFSSDEYTASANMGMQHLS